MNDTHDQVRNFYRRAAAADPSERAGPPDERWGAVRYDADCLEQVPEAAAALSMGCGNPHTLAHLAEGETVLDLGSGAGMDVILSAQRVGPAGKAYGVDFLDEMGGLARRNATEAGVGNVEFLAGTIEDVPLPDDAVDVVISNCVINLAPDKAPVFAEMARLLRAGGRVAVSDVVADQDAPPPDPAAEEAWAECGAGALTAADYAAMLEAAGFADVEIELTHDVGPGLHGAAIRAVASPGAPVASGGQGEPT